MSETLAALHAAIIAAPTDRTVRLVYADALDESGEPSHAARAEFIRLHIALESLPEGDPQQVTLSARCSELFQENWIDWWRPVCAAVGLPEPYVPTRRLRERVKRLVGREKRQPGAPYTAHSHAWSISSEEHGFTAQFIAGFPELLYVQRFTIDTITGQVGTWLGGAPFCRLRLAEDVSQFEWESLNGPHLAKLSERPLTAYRKPPRRSPPGQTLRNLASLKVQALNPTGVVRDRLPPGVDRLRSLTLSGSLRLMQSRCSPNALRWKNWKRCRSESAKCRNWNYRLAASVEQSGPCSTNSSCDSSRGNRCRRDRSAGRITGPRCLRSPAPRFSRDCEPCRSSTPDRS